MAVDVRRARPDDLDELVDLRRAVAAEGIWIGAEAPIDEAGDREKMAMTVGYAADDPAGAMFVAVDGGGIVGNLVLVNPIGVADLGMNVAASHRGRGVGAALLEAGLDWARRVGAHKVALQHWPWNQRARALYERFGFEEEGYLRRHYRRRDGSLWDAAVMGLVLDQTSPGHEERAVEPPGR